MAFAVPQKWEEEAMKTSSLFVASLAVATLSFASANAEKNIVPVAYATTTGNCSTTTWPMVSPVQCSKPYAHSYVECTSMIKKNGGDPSGAWWWCSNQGFKN
jgi:hypothetical protein